MLHSPISVLRIPFTVGSGVDVYATAARELLEGSESLT